MCTLSPFFTCTFSFSRVHFHSHMLTLLHAGFFSHDLSFSHALDFSPILTFMCPRTLSQNLVLDPFHTLMLAFSHMYSFSVHLSLPPCIPSLSFLCCLPLYSLCITFLAFLVPSFFFAHSFFLVHACCFSCNHTLTCLDNLSHPCAFLSSAHPFPCLHTHCFSHGLSFSSNLSHTLFLSLIL